MALDNDMVGRGRETNQRGTHPQLQRAPGSQKHGAQELGLACIGHSLSYSSTIHFYSPCLSFSFWPTSPLHKLVEFYALSRSLSRTWLCINKQSFDQSSSVRMGKEDKRSRNRGSRGRGGEGNEWKASWVTEEIFVGALGGASELVYLRESSGRTEIQVQLEEFLSNQLLPGVCLESYQKVIFN